MKERNKIYPLHEMLPGERFYFARDRKKVVWQLSDTIPFEIKKQAGYSVKYANCRKGSASIFSNEQFKANSHSVIYLRNQ
jgi:hypothetical protein